MRQVLTRAKQSVRAVPVLGPCLVRLWIRLHRVESSADYWEQRYKAGGNSGVGSHSCLAEFKAEFLNRFVEEHQIATVIEFGCGDGAQLRLAKYPQYTGVDISNTTIENCRSAFVGDSTRHFVLLDALSLEAKAELALSLDVVYHLIEDSVFDAYMRRLFGAAEKFVIIYSSNVDEKWDGSHVRHRQFTPWVEANLSQWRLSSVQQNIYPFDPRNSANTSRADFYVFARN